MKREVILDWFIRVIVLFSLVGVFVTYSGQKHLSDCVATWADNYTAVQTIRSNTNTDRNDALHALLIDALGSPVQTQANRSQELLIAALASGDPDKVLSAAKIRLADLRAAEDDPKLVLDVERYISADATYRTAVQTHPLPDPPKEVC